MTRDFEELNEIDKAQFIYDNDQYLTKPYARFGIETIANLVLMFLINDKGKECQQAYYCLIDYIEKESSKQIASSSLDEKAINLSNLISELSEIINESVLNDEVKEGMIEKLNKYLNHFSLLNNQEKISKRPTK